jgi:hypothetical protein
VLTAKGLQSFRFFCGALAILGGLILVVPSDRTRPLGVSLLLLGAFILGHLQVERAYQRTRLRFQPPANGGAGGGNRSWLADTESQTDEGLRDFAAAFIATSGVILGLLTVFGEKAFSLTIKVGIGALVADILIGFVLGGLVLAAPDHDDQMSWNFVRYVFNLALWSLALGILCIGVELLYR